MKSYLESTNLCYNLGNLEDVIMSDASESPQPAVSPKFKVYKGPCKGKGKTPQRWKVTVDPIRGFGMPGRQGYLEADAIDAIAAEVVRALAGISQSNQRDIKRQKDPKILQNAIAAKIKQVGRNTSVWLWLKSQSWDMDENHLSTYHSFMTPFAPISEEEEREFTEETTAYLASLRGGKVKMKQEPGETPEQSSGYVDLTTAQDTEDESRF
jgi:hypothetical protein